MKTAEFLSSLYHLGITIKVENGSLRINAPKGVLSAEMQQQLRERKEEILLFFTQTRVSEEDGLKIQPVQRSEKIVLSYAQRRLWFLNQLEGSSATYNIPSAYRIQGKLDVPALEKAFQTLLARHEILRTSFQSINGEPVQIIAPMLDWKLDIRDGKITDLEAELQAAANLPFDLTQSPLMRAHLWRHTDEEYTLLFNIHHIISDGWSQDIIERELGLAYINVDLPVQPLQYVDYTIWQHDWLGKGALEKQLAFWQKTLEDAPALLELPGDHPRPAKQSYRGSSLTFELDAALGQALQQLARANQSTLFMVLFAAFAVLLQRYSRQRDIVIGTPVANRQRAELEGMLGFFVNTLPFRVDLSGNPTFSELIAQVRQFSIEAFTHQDIPFEKLVEALHPQRTLSYAPIFQVMFSLQNTTAELTLHDLQVARLPVSSNTSKFDLSLSMEMQANGLKGAFEFNTDLFEPATIGRISEQFQVLLQGIAQNSEQLIDELPLLTVAEHSLLQDWNATSVSYPENLCVHQLFEQQAARTPDAIAVIFENSTLTYRQLNQRANQLARHLQTLGVGPDVLVGICLDRSLEMVIGIYGIIKAGGAYVPLDPAYPQDRLHFMLQDAGVDILLTQEKRLPTLQGQAATLLCLDRDWSQMALYSDENLTCAVDQSNLAYMIYTSGSTGRPKGALNTHAGIFNRLFDMHEIYRIDQTDTILQKTSFSFDVSVWELLWPLMFGARLVLARPDGHKDPQYLVETIQRESVTIVHFVPSMLNAVLDVPNISACKSLKWVLCGGEAMPVDLMNRFFTLLSAELHNKYGPAEAAIDVCYRPCTPATHLQSVPIGRPVANTQFYILNDSLQPMPINVPAELYVGGVQVGRGYHQRPALTAEKFIPNPFGQGRLYKTGDLARWLPDGNIEYLGRIDYQVKLRGFRIELGEIEAILSEHPDVRDAVVMLREDQPGEKYLAAYLVASQNAQLENELRQSLKRRVPEYMIPSAFAFLDQLPLNPNGKLDRKALPAPHLQISQSPYTAPRSALEEMLANIWQEILHKDRVGVHSNFFDLGGHSLLAIQVLSRIWNFTNIRVPLQIFFEHPTIAELSSWMSAQDADEITHTQLRHIPGAEKIALSYAQQRLWFLSQLEGSSATYNIPFAYCIRGKLDVPALERAFQTLLMRHEIWRTSFQSVDGEPQQVISPVVDWHLDIQTSDDLAALANLPFDLTQPPLMRAHLWQHSDQEYTLLFNIHHIISDGWSQGIIERELALAYVNAELPRQTLQYADYAVWQRDWLSKGVLEKQLAFWKRTLNGAPALLELPTDHPRPPKQSYLGSTVDFELDSTLSAALQQLARAHQSTLFMLLLSAFAVLLQRYSRQGDIVIGTPVANRQHSEVEGVLGFFVNTLPLRVDLSGNPTFSALLAKVRQLSLEAFTHQDLPFEKLVEELHPQRTLSYTPVFQVMFTLQNTAPSALVLGDLQVTSLPIESDVAKFDLSLVMDMQAASLKGVLQFNTDLFVPATIKRMAQHFTVLLEAIVKNSQQPIGILPIITAAERLQLQTWNETGAPSLENATVIAQFEQQAARTPDAVAVVFENTHLTYRELNERANQLAHHLQSLGVRPDVLIGICLERSLEMVLAVLGVLKAGGAYVPMDPAYPQERINHMVTDAQINILITHQAICSRLSLINFNIIDVADLHLLPNLRQNPAPCAAADNLAYVIYTSGSTGKPKGTMLTHAALSNLMCWMQERLPVLAGDRILQKTPFSFDPSVCEIFAPLINGAVLVMAPPEIHRDPHLLVALLAREKITQIIFVPSQFRMILEEKQLKDCHSLRHIICGGEPLTAELVKKAHETTHAQLWNLYGPTETCIISTGWHTANFNEHFVIPIGRPVDHLQTYILDEQQNPLPVGVPGELYISGIQLARGYFNRPDLTAARFVPNPFSKEPGARMYRTGDLARWLPDGNLEYLGRVDDQVKLRGFRIELGEIEAVLEEHADVREAAVLLREDQPGDKYLVAYVATEKNSAELEGALRAYIKQHIPDYMIPSVFVFLDQLPLTPNEKVDRKALPVPEKSAVHHELTAPRNALEQKIAAIWQKVLGVSQIGIDDNFFGFGGDSLKTIHVVHDLEHACTVMDIFTYQTIRELAAYLSSQKDDVVETRTHLLYELTPPQSALKGKVLSLVCVPAAGGNAIVYKDLADQLPTGYSLYALEMPGHDLRHANESFLSWPELAARCVAEIKTKITGPIALYGHSAGASLALEIARLLEHDQIIPTGVYLGANFPHMRLSGKLFEWLNIDRLVSDRFYEDAQRMVVGSLFDEFDPQEKAIRTRSWRHDGLQNQDYYTNAQSIWQGYKLKAPIISVVGEKDRSTEFYPEEVNDWFLFADTVDLSVIPHAGHYFMKHQASALAGIIVEKHQQFKQGKPVTHVVQPKTKPAGVSLSRFLVVAGGQFISAIGTIISSFALGAWIYKSTGAVSDLTSVAFFQALPFILFLPIAGAVADRWDRRKILLACDGLAILNTLLLAVLIFSGGLQIWHLWGFSTVYAITSAFQQPAYLAAVAQLVPKRYLSQANGFVQLGQAIGNVIAPLLGGFMIEAIQLNGIVIVDLITYLFGFVGLVITRFPNTMFKKEEEPVIKSIMGGWRYLLRRRGLLGLAIYFAGSNIGNSALSVLLIPYILSIGTGNLLGVALGTWGVGAVIGSALMVVWGGLQSRARGIIVSTILMSTFIIMTGLSTTPLWLCMSLLGAGFFYSLCVGHFYPLLQIKISEELLGRILSTFRVISYSTIPLAYLMVGPLVDKVFNPLTQPNGLISRMFGPILGTGPGRGMGWLLVLAGFLMIVWSGLVFLYRPLREIETDLPDALMEAVIDDDKDRLQMEADKLLRQNSSRVP